MIYNKPQINYNKFKQITINPHTFKQIQTNYDKSTISCNTLQQSPRDVNYLGQFATNQYTP